MSEAGAKPELDAPAARPDGRQHRVFVRGDQHECRVRRRLLERLQEGVLGGDAHRVRRIDDDDAGAALVRREGDGALQLAYLVDADFGEDAAVVGGVEGEGVDVGVDAGGDAGAGAAFAAGLRDGRVSQFRAWASWSASVALPTRSGPTKRYERGGRSPASERWTAARARGLPAKGMGIRRRRASTSNTQARGANTATSGTSSRTANAREIATGYEKAADEEADEKPDEGANREAVSAITEGR